MSVNQHRGMGKNYEYYKELSLMSDETIDRFKNTAIYFSLLQRRIIAREMIQRNSFDKSATDLVKRLNIEIKTYLLLN